MVLTKKGVDVGENMSLRRSLRKGYTTEVLDRVSDIAVIEANNRWVNYDCDL